MYNFSDVKTVHLEITTKCNARCPMCLHTVLGGKANSQLPLVELSIDDIKNIFPKTFILQLKKMYMCGNYGDPMVAKDTLSVFEYMRSLNSKMNLGMFSNGSGRTVDWWKDLAKVTSSVHFSIDGLEDTNHIYRRGTRFDKIIENAKAYIQAGGYAIWDFIVFRHNEHQVEDVQKLALDLGFKECVVKKTGRFFSNTKAQGKDRQEVFKVNGEFDYFIEKPKQRRFQNDALEKESELVETYGSLSNYLDKTQIKCKVASEKSIYVSAEALVFPCCWTANQMYPWYLKEKSSQIWKLIKNKDNINAKNKSISEILAEDFFKDIENSWKKESLDQGKLKVCAKTCGSEFDPFKSQFS